MQPALMRDENGQIIFELVDAVQADGAINNPVEGDLTIFISHQAWLHGVPLLSACLMPTRLECGNRQAVGSLLLLGAASILTDGSRPVE